MEATQVLAALAALGVPLKGIIDAIRRQRPTLDGLTVQIIAAALGAVMAFAIDFRATEALLELAGLGSAAGRVPIPAVDYIVTGIGIAAAAGLFAELSGRSGGSTTIVEVDATGRHL